MASPQTDKRKFFRHPISVPIQYHEQQKSRFDRSDSIDLSEGGICFLADHFLARGMAVDLMIPVGDQTFKVNGEVAYCNRMPHMEQFRTGVVFRDADTAFRVKLVEQMIQVKVYQKKLIQKTGREVSEEEAAREWIAKYAKHFSSLF